MNEAIGSANDDSLQKIDVVDRRRSTTSHVHTRPPQPHHCDRFMKRCNLPRQVPMIDKDYSQNNKTQFEVEADLQPLMSKSIEGNTISQHLREVMAPTESIKERPAKSSASGQAKSKGKEAKNIDLDRFTDEISGIKLGILFGPYQQHQQQAQNQMQGPTTHSGARRP